MGFVARTAWVALPLAAGFVATMLPAVAQQDSYIQQFNDIRNAVGLAPVRPPIDFTERPPLVVPPTNTLPPPMAASSEKLPVVDPDAYARRRALTDSRRPVPPTDPGAGATGRSARTYLVDPPSGMRDPDTVASDRSFDKGKTAERKASRRRHARRRKHAVEAAK